MTNKQVLMMIAAFVTITLGSFIWYVATWDANKRSDAISTDAPLFILAQKLPPEAPALTTGTLL